jgi:diguanylate cyclase (GGDEF)-like protein
MGDNLLRDALTGAHSRATLQERLREEVERARRYDLPLTLLVVDLDHFKSINDAFGHTRGDLVLIGFVERLRGLIRDSDLLFRYGGDEFVLVLLHTDRPQARVLAGRLLEGMRATPFSGNPPLSITLSIGSGSFPDDGQTPEDLFECADRRLYEAKRHGRDRVVLEDPLTLAPMSFETGSRLMERELPLSTLRQFFDQLPGRQHGALSISGPAGSGKTWFLAEAVKMARLRGYAAWSLEGRSALRSRVYGAVMEAKAIREGLPPPAAGERVFVRAVQTFINDENKAGLILAVDNLADLDHDSLELVRRLLVTADIPVTGLIYTVDPASAYQSTLLEAPLQVQVELRPLTALGVRLWLRSALRWEAPDDFCEWLQAQTGGLPGKLQAGLAHLIAREVLQPQEGGWSVASPYGTLALRDELARLLQPPPSNLPATSTGFVGRDEELQALKQHLAEAPLVALVGPGGIGKTRLALQTAAELLDHFRDGAYYVSLTSVSTPDVLIATLARVLGLTLSGAAGVHEQLLNYLAGRALLLLLDDLTYLLPATDLLMEIQQRAPKVRLLVTARERLDLPGVTTVELAGLPIPPAAAEAVRGGALPASHYSAEQLFVLAARRARLDFALSDEDRREVRRICQLVDGMPLGLELAAAWTPLFSCAEIARQIEQNLDFLTTARVDIPERQRSTRAVLDYFWGLLAEDERRRLRRLSVFRSGFEREAARDVADASLFFLSALVDKAFLHRLASGRYEMHELLRQFAEQSLTERPDEQAAAGDQHCRYYAEFMDDRRAAVKGAGQAEALAAIHAELGNVRAAWEWAAAHGQAEALDQCLESLVLFYDLQNWYHEGAETFTRAVESWRARAEPQSVPDASGAGLLIGHGIFSHRLGLNSRAAEALQQGLAVLLPLEADRAVPEVALAQYFLGLVRLDLGDYDTAHDLFAQSLERQRRGNDRYGIGLALNEMSRVALRQGQYGAAHTLVEEALAVRRGIGDQHGLAASLSVASELALELGELDRARAFLEECAALNHLGGSQAGQRYVVRHQGWLAQARGDFANARRCYQASLAYHQESGNPKEIAQDLLGLGAVALQVGTLDEAEHLHDESLALCRQAGYRAGLVRALVGLGDVCLARAAAVGEGGAVAALALPGAMDRQAYAHYAEALSVARDMAEVPWVLAAAVGLAAVSARAGHEAGAVEALTMAVYHPASNHHTRLRAGRLLSRLEAELPPAVVSEAEERGRHGELAETVARLLEFRLPPA